MNTTFKAGETVQANATAQGMKRYARYAVVEVQEQYTPFGNFVTYILADLLDYSTLAVRNGHLLLSKVES